MVFDFSHALHFGILLPLVCSTLGGIVLVLDNRRSDVYGYLIPVFFISLGYLYAKWFYYPQNWIFNVKPTQQYVYLQIEENPVVKEKSVRVHAKIVDYKKTVQAGQSILYFQKDSLSVQLKVGQILLAKAFLMPFSKPKNEGEFDLFSYRFRKGVLTTAFIPSNHWKLISYQKKPFANWRNTLLARVQNAFAISEHSDVAKALVFGYEEDIDEETKSAFQKSGIIHVLAVSGMHVSIIWLILSKAFFFLDKKFFHRIIKLLLILSLLWLYAAITGFSPSILRATVMFSFMAWAKLRNKSKNTWNILCVSAFFILLLSPSFLFDAGFWLSYLAVVGIMIGGPFWKSYLENKHFIIRWLLEMIFITLIAQLFTMFYSITMFGTFPNWFLINNLIAVPLSSLALIEGLLYLALADIPFLGEILAWFFRILILAMIESAVFFEKLPYSYSEGISFNMFQAILSYAALAYGVWCVNRKKFRKLYVSFLAMVFVFSIHFFYKNKARNFTGLIVYSIRNNAYMEWIEHGVVWQLLPSSLDEKSKQFSVQGFKRKYYLPQKTYLYSNSNFWVSDRGAMWHVDQGRINPDNNRYALCWSIAQKVLPPENYEALPKLIILHANMPTFIKEKWSDFAMKNQIQIYDVKEQGMLKMRFL